ncbi:2-keto-4-pentenoate hydratase [Alteromonas portus]|uniref:2-keto-4-pentenoate hydratase n=1 Tax=Alteromonas portus TaxID=2565549 RepID=A0A4U0ZIV7_9ALTE|nr:MASE1 domain-containing protein [Alteromonas portus]TKB03030.1 2-keto-4-pentenoate hydratase [Alteromonas portus]
MKITRYINTNYVILGLVYTAFFHGVWLFSTQYEIVSGTVSWYLPAGIRLAAFLLLPLCSWPLLLIAEKLTHFILFHPGGVLDNTAFLSGSTGWYLVHLLISPAVICFCAYLFRRRIQAPYFDNVNSTLATLAFGVLTSVALGTVFLGRRAIEVQTDIEIFLSILFDFSLGDFVGIVVLCPLLFALYTRQYVHKGKLTLYLTAGTWLLLLASSHYLYSDQINISYQIKYLAVFPALFLSYRYAVMGSALSCLLIGITAFVVASQSTLPPIEHQFYILALCVSCLILGASINQSKVLNKELAKKNEDLEASVKSAQALATQLVNVQENERKRLSRDLHDDFGHRIVDLKLQLSIKSKGDDNEILLNKIDALYQAMKKSLGGLRPSGIDTLPIENVIQRSEIITTLKKANIDCFYELNGTPVSFNSEQKIHIYRIVQEAVTNSIKYANATSLWIKINYEPHTALFTISDDGDGIPQHITQAENAEPTLGLLSMKERAKLINGTLDIFHGNQSGTVVRLSVPTNDLH